MSKKQLRLYRRQFNPSVIFYLERCMLKTKNFKVVNGRFHFKCSVCQAKRLAAAPQNVRKRSFRCHKCKQITRCNLNRRMATREQQYGKALVRSSGGNEFEVDLVDISLHGIGFDVHFNDLRKISIGKTCELRCSWNPRLFPDGRYVIRTIKSRRVGAELARKTAR